MIPEDLAALALADSVGALDPDDRAELTARRAELSPDEQAELGRLYDVATALATAVDVLEPPARVRQRVLAAAHARRDASRREAVMRIDPSWFIRTRSHRPPFRKPR